jgi:hypothetical protein
LVGLGELLQLRDGLIAEIQLVHGAKAFLMFARPAAMLKIPAVWALAKGGTLVSWS